MNSIELVAIETSGLNPDKEIILEVAVARYITDGSPIKGQSSPIDPGSFNLSADCLHFHQQTGLIADLMKERIPLSEAAAWLGPCNLRIVWQLGFARPFLAKSSLSSILGNAIDAQSVLELARVLRDVSPVGEPRRAGGKVALIAGALRALGAA